MPPKDTFTGPTVWDATAGKRPRWLASLRSVDEIRVAADYPIDIFDLKEPHFGPLAPVGVDTWQAVAAEFPDRTLSAALGESDVAITLADEVPPEFAFAKAGPSGLGDAGSLRRMWEKIADLLPNSTDLVAVTYADHVAARCISPEVVFDQAAATGMKRVLVDTFIKDGRTSRDHLSIDRLRGLSKLAADTGLWWTLAGSIRIGDLAALFDAGVRPDCIGVRGDLCDRGRTGELSRARLQDWTKTLGGT